MRNDSGTMLPFCLIGGALLLLILSIPFWAWGTSTYTDKFGLEMPEQGDVGWDDAIRTNHKLFEVAVQPILEGHCVTSGLTVYHISGATVWWDAGYIRFNNAPTEYYVASGATTPVDNTVTWLSAVTEGVESGATMQARSTEYDIPSSASGFSHVPICAVWTEAGNVVRLKDLKHMPGTRYRMDQDVDSGSTPSFSGIYVTDLSDSSKVNIRSGVTLPSGTSPESMPGGGAYIDTNDANLEIGIAGQNYALSLEERIFCVISSPANLGNPSQQPIWWNDSNSYFFITGATFYASDSGVTIEGLVYSDSRTNLQLGSGTTIFNFISIATAGTSVYSTSYSTGVTAVPPDRAIVMDYGVTDVDWIAIELTGRRLGAKP